MKESNHKTLQVFKSLFWGYWCFFFAFPDAGRLCFG